MAAWAGKVEALAEAAHRSPKIDWSQGASQVPRHERRSGTDKVDAMPCAAASSGEGGPASVVEVESMR